MENIFSYLLCILDPITLESYFATGFFKRNWRILTDKVDYDQVQNDAGEKKVSEGALWANVVKIGFVLRIALNAQAGCQDERPEERGKRVSVVAIFH